MIAQLAFYFCDSAVAVRCVRPGQPLPFQLKTQNVTHGREQPQLSHRFANKKSEYLLLVIDILRLFVTQWCVLVADQYRGES